MKRPAPSSALGRRVRARREEEPEPASDGSLSEPSDEEAPSEEMMSDDEDNGEEASESDDDQSEPNKPSASTKELSNISFGALAKAQASMPSSRRRTGAHAAEEEPDDSDSDSPNQPDDKSSRRKKQSAPGKRTSKHAPTEMSSKRPVSRKREFSTISRPEPRDPRFDPAIASGSTVNEAKAKKAYAFLDDYRASEMAALRTEIKKTKDEGEKERLKRLLASMESRKRADEKKDRERKVLEEHRQKEKDLVKQGKQPFYLKKSEQKKRLLTEQFKGMKKRQVDKVIERKRKKVAAKEKKELDHLQRRG